MVKWKGGGMNTAESKGRGEPPCKNQDCRPGKTNGNGTENRIQKRLPAAEVLA
jgi:hypothetical protein